MGSQIFSELNCEQCGSPFLPKSPIARFCSKRCSRRAGYDRDKDKVKQQVSAWQAANPEKWKKIRENVAERNKQERRAEMASRAAQTKPCEVCAGPISCSRRTCTRFCSLVCAKKAEYAHHKSGYIRRYREENREKILAGARKYHAENRDKSNERSRLYREANLDLHKRRIEEWRAAHPDQVRLHSLVSSRKRQFIMSKACPKWLSKADHRKIAEIYRMAKRITKETGIPHQVDHIVPIRGKHVSGLHLPWNLQILSKAANRRKSNKLVLAETVESVQLSLLSA